MSLFDTILGAVNDSDRVADPSMLGSVLNTVQQLSQSSNNDPSTIQTALGIVGKYVQSGLQQERQHQGQGKVEDLVERYSGTQPNEKAVQSILSTPQIQQLTSELESRTGLSLDSIGQLLPMMVPLVLQLLQSGKDGQNPRTNSVLSHFLDSDRDGDVDIKDAVQMAAQYLNR